MLLLRFFVANSSTSSYLDQKFTFHCIFFKIDCPDISLERITLFLHSNGVFLSHEDSHLKGNYENMGVLFYENVDWPFVPYQFYLEVFSRVRFNSLKKKILPILSKGYSDNSRNEQKYSPLIFQEKVTEKFFRLSADLVFDWICYINDIVDAYVFHYVFLAYKQKSRLLFT